MGNRGLVHGRLGPGCLHLCVDMQRLFATGHPWAVPWLERVVPVIETLCARHAERTLTHYRSTPQGLEERSR